MNKILKASAGTGKTYRLSLEYVASLLAGIDYTEIVVMTFTKKATAEIRERIISHIENILEDGEDSSIFGALQEIAGEESMPDGDFLERIYKEMLENKDQIHIHTIDSFINLIFQKVVAPYLGLYSYEIIEEDENRELLSDIFRRVLDNRRDFALLEDFLLQTAERKIENYIDLLDRLLKNRWKFLLLGDRSRPRREGGGLVEPFEEALGLLEEIARTKGKSLDPDFFKKDFRPVWENYSLLGSSEARKDLLLKNRKLLLKTTFWNGNKVRGKAVSEERAGLKEAYDQFLSHLAVHVFNTEMVPYEEEIFRFSQRIFALYDRLKLKRKVFTHTDINNYTYYYLKKLGPELFESGGATDSFFELIGGRITSLLIDEFQDTSILQWNILKPLADRVEHLVVVGDEKQSIYGWRGGEKELFGDLEGILKEQAETLDTCYRSEQEIVSFVNSFFSQIDRDWDYRVVENLPENDGGFVQVLLGGDKLRVNTGTKTFAKKSEEKQQAIIERNQKITADLPAEIARILKKFSDCKQVGVLARTNHDLEVIAAELDRNGIPYILKSKDSMLEHKAIKPLYALLSYLAHRDYFQLISFLRSDLVGVGDRIFKHLLEKREEVRAFMQGEQSGAVGDELDTVLAEIRGLFELDYRHLTDWIFLESGVLDLFAGNGGALKNLFHFHALMKQFDSLSAFIEYAEENRTRDELRQADLKETDAVQLLTIHQAKGLSFETEIFYWRPQAGGGGGGHELRLYVEFDETYTSIVDYLLTSTRFRSLFEHLNIDFAAERKRKALIEEINNIYVALTRPEKNLFVCIEGPRQLAGDRGGRYWTGSERYGFFEKALLSACGVDSLIDLVEPKRLGKFVHAGGTGEGDDSRHALCDISPYFSTGAEQPEEEKEGESELNIGREYGRIAGLAAHFYLEHVKHDQPHQRDYARQMVLSRYGNILGPRRAKKLIRGLEEFIDSNPEYFVDRWQVFTEYEIADGKRSHRIDRLMIDRRRAEVRIVDFKTGVHQEESQLGRYRKLVEDRLPRNYKISTEFVELALPFQSSEELNRERTGEFS